LKHHRRLGEQGLHKQIVANAGTLLIINIDKFILILKLTLLF